MPAAGDIVAGFSLVRPLGAGGMGQTWEAVRRLGTDFEQRVAIKLPLPEVIRSREGLDLLRREASLCASLRHPNIAAVLDFSEAEGFIVCELVDGAALSDVLREAPSHRLSTPQLVHVVAQVARGLSYAHRRLLRGEPSPVIHRDLSPSNLVVDYDGNVKIVDFGLAKAVRLGDRSETVKGKLAYMAPEQAMGQSLTPAVDQYSLGVIAYELAAGERPHDGMHDAQTLKNVLNGRHIPVGRRAPSLPSGLAEVIERMISFDPEERYATVDTVVEALQPFTPPLSVQRELAVLVHRAQPTQTIVQVDGRFVSRAVGIEALPLERAIEAGDGRPPSQSPMAYAPPDAPARTSTQVPAPSGRVPVQSVASGTLFEPPKAAPHQTWIRMLLVSLAGVAIGLFLGWASDGPVAPEPSLAASPPAREALPPEAHARPLVAASPGVSATQPAATELARGEELAAKAKVPTPARARVMQASRGPAHPVTVGRGLVRIKVFPWGRVWIDGVVRGSVPPILQVQLAPGPHTIAAGQDVPVETREVTVREGEAAQFSFDLTP